MVSQSRPQLGIHDLLAYCRLLQRLKPGYMQRLPTVFCGDSSGPNLGFIGLL